MPDFFELSTDERQDALNYSTRETGLFITRIYSSGARHTFEPADCWCSYHSEADESTLLPSFVCTKSSKFRAESNFSN